MLNKKPETRYEKQAREFAEKIGLSMTAVYLGHYPRFENSITANFRITLTRPGKSKPFGFDFSTSINDSWRYRIEGWNMFKKFPGLPPRTNLKSFFGGYLKKPITSFGQYQIEQTKKVPSLYDVLTCLTKYDPGSFSNFCADYGYDEDSKKADKTYEAVKEEWREVERMFGDVMEELQEIN